MNKALFLLASVLFVGCKTENSNAGTADSTATDTSQQEAKTYENNPELKIDVSKEAFNDFWYGNTEALVIMSREDAPLTIEQITVNNNYVLLSDTSISGTIEIDNNCIGNSTVGDYTGLTNAREAVKKLMSHRMLFIDSSINKKQTECYADDAVVIDTFSYGEAPPKPAHTKLLHNSTTYSFKILYDKPITLEMGETYKIPKTKFHKTTIDESGISHLAGETLSGTFIKVAFFTNLGMNVREWNAQQ